MAILFLFWFIALFVPFWQDDYIFLLKAKELRLMATPWYAAFLPESKNVFWRPLGFDMFWRMVEGPLGGNVHWAHLINILLLIAAATATGWFAFTFLRLEWPERDSVLGGIGAGFLYGIHGSHFLSAVWVAAANDSLVVLFSALTLTFWLRGLYTTQKSGYRALPFLLIFFFLALFSKEGAIVLPAIGLLLAAWMWPKRKPVRRFFIFSAIWGAAALTWLSFYQNFRIIPDQGYAFDLGLNTVRNALSFFLFFFNVPRETLRFILVEKSMTAAVWGSLCFLFQAAAIFFILKGIGKRLKARQFVILILFFGVGCAPYLLLTWNCYAYYMSILNPIAEGCKSRLSVSKTPVAVFGAFHVTILWFQVSGVRNTRVET